MYTGVGWMLCWFFTFKNFTVLSLDSCENFTKATLLRCVIWRSEKRKETLIDFRFRRKRASEIEQSQWRTMNVFTFGHAAASPYQVRNPFLNLLESHIVKHPVKRVSVGHSSHQSYLAEESVFTHSVELFAMSLMLITILHLHRLQKMSQWWVNRFFADTDGKDCSLPQRERPIHLSWNWRLVWKRLIRNNRRLECRSLKNGKNKCSVDSRLTFNCWYGSKAKSSTLKVKPLNEWNASRIMMISKKVFKSLTVTSFKIRNLEQFRR